ncbi:MAG: CcmD family protein [Labilithrix sp.]|nr:CcmD family protein [Labilithrix sp.]MCW5814449.1 CcmD family protein [Labilithrix sp.]
MTTQEAPKPEDRAEVYTATAETGEQYNGYTLMVEAYAAIWLIVMGWLVLLWRQQASLTARVTGLEAAIDRAEKKMRGPKGAPPKKDEA